MAQKALAPTMTIRFLPLPDPVFFSDFVDIIRSTAESNRERRPISGRKTTTTTATCCRDHGVPSRKLSRLLAFNQRRFLSIVITIPTVNAVTVQLFGGFFLGFLWWQFGVQHDRRYVVGRLGGLGVAQANGTGFKEPRGRFAFRVAPWVGVGHGCGKELEERDGEELKWKNNAKKNEKKWKKIENTYTNDQSINQSIHETIIKMK